MRPVLLLVVAFVLMSFGPSPVVAQTGRSYTAQPRTGSSGTGAITWAETPKELRGRNGQRFTYVCPPNGALARVWGTDVYTDDSSICTAAVHVGQISQANGGTVTIEMRPGQPSYMGTGRYGVMSESYGGWSSSFVVIAAAAAPQGRSYTTQPRQAAASCPEGASGNLALNKPAQQSSTSQWSHANDAQGAVDGVKNGRYAFHTNHEANPWWQVDLQGVCLLAELRIFNRLDCCAERARTIRVLLSTDGTAWQQVYAHNGQTFGGTDGKPLIVPLNGMPARFVRLQLNDTNWLHLDEVEISTGPGGPARSQGGQGDGMPTGRSYTAQPRRP